MSGNITSLLDKVKENPILLDAIYQWATAPTGSTAVHTHGVPPNHGLIKSNIMSRYDLTEEKTGEIYNELIKEIESTGFNFDSGFLEAENEVKKYFDKNDILKDTVLQRLESAKDDEKYIVWFFCKIKDDGNIWNGRDGGYGNWEYYYKVSNRFEALLYTTFNICAPMSKVSDLLIKLGFLNKLEWVGSKIKYDHSKRGNELIFPHYLEPIAKDIDEYVTLPDLPDFRKLVDVLFEEKRVEALVAMEELLKNGWIEKQKLTGGIILCPSIIDEKNDVITLNLTISEPLKKYLFGRKRNEIEMVADGVDQILNQLSEKHYPDISSEAHELFNGTKAWNIHTMNNSLSEKDIMLISTPWLTGEQIKVLKNEGSAGYTIILVSMMDIPKLNNIYRNIFGEDINKMSDDWIIVDEIMFEMVLNGKPPELYTAIVEELKKTGFSIGGQVGGRGTNEGTDSEPDQKKENEDIIRVLLGDDVFWEPGLLNNGHFIIIGGAGAGKTETIRCITSELEKQKYPVLMVDFHGDMACKNCNMKTYEMREGSEYYFNPLELDPEFEEITPLRANSDFVDAMLINFPNLGIQQKDDLRGIIKKSYNELGITTKKETWNRELNFKDIENKIKRSEGKTTQTLKAYLADVFDYELFSGSKKLSVGDILGGGVTHLNLKSLPESSRSLFADLFLRKLYYSVQSKGPIPTGDHVTDMERFRLFVIVDEAKLLVSEKQGTKAVLNKYATELRKCGVGLILASQLIAHFTDEISSNIAAKLCMKAESKKQAKENYKHFGVEETDILNLEQGEGVLIRGNDPEGVKIKIKPTWER